MLICRLVLVRSLNQLVMVPGGCDYLDKRAHMRYVTGHTHADWLIDCSTKVFSFESFPLYGTCVIVAKVC